MKLAPNAIGAPTSASRGAATCVRTTRDTANAPTNARPPSTYAILFMTFPSAHFHCWVGVVDIAIVS